MSNLLILWALPEKEQDYKKYETIINIFKNNFWNINSPIDTKDFIWTDNERFKRAVRFVEEAGLIIWESSLPSTWQWIELGIAYTLNKKVIIIAESNSKISGLIKGNPNIGKIIFYDNLRDLENKLNKQF